MIRTSRASLPILAALVALAGGCACWRDDGGALAATADMLNEQGRSIGTAELRQVGDGVVIDMQVSGLAPGVHAMHIHNNGDCHTPGAEGKAFTDAGAHFNPHGKKHGKDNPNGPHAGDLPNFTVSGDGTAKVHVTAAMVTLVEGEKHSLFQPGGTCIVLHAGPDDYKSDPAGNSGDRIACGVIRKK